MSIYNIFITNCQTNSVKQTYIEEFMALNGPISKVRWAKLLIKQIDNLVESDENTRKILFCIGSKGGEGKSFLARWLYLRGKVNKMKSTQILTTLDYDSVVSMWDTNSKILIFDLPLNYTIQQCHGILLEDLKSGVLDRGKYQRKMKQFKQSQPIIVVFTNKLPPGNLYMPDRYDNACFQIIDGELHELKRSQLPN